VNCPKLRNRPVVPRRNACLRPRQEATPLRALWDQKLNPGDRVVGLGNLGNPTREFGTVAQANEDDAVVIWDGDGRIRLHQRSLKKV
jgi:hypothetical protein